MLACAVKNSANERDGTLLDLQHRLRARVFAGRLGWNVRVEDGRESDEFDALDPTYILALTDTGAVAGCARLLPATGPTMLAQVFPQLLFGGRLVTHAAMIESSRFCVDTGLQAQRGKGALHDATLTMFAAIIEWSVGQGHDEIVTATDIRFERILARAGWPMRRLGEPCLIGNTMAVAGSLPARREHFERLRPVGYQSDFDAPGKPKTRGQG